MVSFTRKEKEVIGILSLGTFLEYFDFYLYFHYAVFLNKIFFSEGDKTSNFILLSLAYLSSFIFRPIGAFVFGYVGDHYGRKVVINLTFILMGISCIGIFYLPTYEEIGVWASIMITFYRALQGICTMGEIVGGEVYLSEYLKGKKVFIGLLILFLMCSIGCQVALYGIRYVLSHDINWRYLFLGGFAIFIVGYFSRRCLVESPAFLNFKLGRTARQQVSNKFYLAAFCIDTLAPMALFISVFGFNSVFRDVFDYSELDLVTRNLNATYCCIAYTLLAIFLSIHINPYILAKVRSTLGILFLLLIPFLMNNCMCLEVMLIIQSLWCILCMGDVHMRAVVFRNSPINIKTRLATLSFSLSRAFIAFLSLVGLNALSDYIGYYSYLVIGLPFMLAHRWGIDYMNEVDKSSMRSLLRNYR